MENHIIEAKGTKMSVIKRELMVENYKDSLFKDKIILKSQQRFRSDHHRVYTEEVNKIVLSSNDDKRLQTYDKITTYPYGTSVIKVCEFIKKNRTSSHMINIDKNKDIDGYVSKLNDVINNKIELLNGVGELIYHIISDIKNETNMIDEKIYKVSEMDNDTLHLINDKVKEFMSQLKQNLKKILV